MNASAQEMEEQKITEKVRDDILKGKEYIVLGSDNGYGFLGILSGVLL